MGSRSTTYQNISLFVYVWALTVYTYADTDISLENHSTVHNTHDEQQIRSMPYNMYVNSDNGYVIVK